MSLRPHAQISVHARGSSHHVEWYKAAAQPSGIHPATRPSNPCVVFSPTHEWSRIGSRSLPCRALLIATPEYLGAGPQTWSWRSRHWVGCVRSAFAGVRNETPILFPLFHCSVQRWRISLWSNIRSKIAGVSVARGIRMQAPLSVTSSTAQTMFALLCAANIVPVFSVMLLAVVRRSDIIV